jgi:hypothetical protein
MGEKFDLCDYGAKFTGHKFELYKKPTEKDYSIH